MTTQEAQERLVCILNNNQFTKADKKAMYLAINAINKQIPKKPRETRCALMCASCGHKITEKGCKKLYRNYCKKCGQRIFWEDE
jgi:hypothetical protein